MALSEKAGSDLLAAIFEARGYEIQRNVIVQEGDFDQRLDGFDPGAKVGFEYITKEAGDDARFTGEILAKLDEMMRKKSMFVFVVDDTLDISEDELTQAGEAFLDYVKLEEEKT